MAQIKLYNRILEDMDINWLACDLAWYLVNQGVYDIEYDYRDSVSMSPRLFKRIMLKWSTDVSEARVMRHVIDATGLDEPDNYDDEELTYHVMLKACLAILDVYPHVPNWKHILRNHVEMRDEMEKDLSDYCEKKGIHGLVQLNSRISDWASKCPKDYLNEYDYSAKDKIAAAYLYLVSTGEIWSGLVKNDITITPEMVDLDFKMRLACASLSREAQEGVEPVEIKELWGKVTLHTNVARYYFAYVKAGLITEV